MGPGTGSTGVGRPRVPGRGCRRHRVRSGRIRARAGGGKRGSAEVSSCLITGNAYPNSAGAYPAGASANRCVGSKAWETRSCPTSGFRRRHTANADTCCLAAALRGLGSRPGGQRTAVRRALAHTARVLVPVVAVATGVEGHPGAEKGHRQWQWSRCARGRERSDRPPRIHLAGPT